MPRPPLPTLLLCAALALPSRAEEAPAPAPAQSEVERLQRTLRAGHRTLPITFDGRPDEEAWKAAEVADAFTQRTPDEGLPATVATRLRVLWDEQFLWVSAECDDPEPPLARLSRRDRWVEGDWLSFDVDTAFDRRTSYHFTVSAGGHIIDGLHFNDTEFTLDWDTAWEAEVAITKKGWSFEARIPLRALRIPEGIKQFGFNAFRRLSRRGEESQWRYTPKGTPGDVSLLGILTGVEGIRPISALEVKPFVATKLTRTWPAPAGLSAPFQAGLCSSLGFAPQTTGAACVGLDLRYSLTSDLTLVATVNPDFGQVEADARQLNLTTFELFFPEKRPFFLEDLDLFRVPLSVGMGGTYGGNAYQLFYSRRIGSALAAPTLAAGQRLLDQPAAQPVAVATKLTGTIGPLSLGILSSLQPRAFAQVLSGDGAIGDLQLADPVHAGALRVRVPAGKNFLGGLSLTSVDPLFSPGARHAHAGAADFTLFDDGRLWTAGGQAAGSLITGGARSTLLDGTVLDPSGKGSAGGAGSLLVTRHGERLGLLFAADYLSRAFDTNDLGYMQRANLLRALALVSLIDPHPNGWRQHAQLNLWGREVHDASGELVLYREAGAEAYTTLSSFWSLGGSLAYAPSHVDDRELEDGTPLERTDAVGASAWFETDRRKRFSLDLSGSLTRSLKRRGWSTGAGLGLLWQPLPPLELSLATSASYETGDLRRIRTASGLPEDGQDPTVTLAAETATQQAREYLLAALTARSISSTLRGTWAFSPHLTLQLYAQLFTANLVYDGALVAIAQPGKATVRYAELVPARAADQAPAADAGDVGLNVNVILRWEWRLGSTLYLVYAHQTSGTYTPPKQGFDAGLSGLATGNGAARGDTLLLKVDVLGAL